jgi:transaldolase
VDGGDPEETRQVQELLGFVHGQTTNPSLIAKNPSGKPIPYEELDLEQGWERFDIEHERTRKGIEKFTADFRATLSRLQD